MSTKSKIVFVVAICVGCFFGVTTSLSANNLAPMGGGGKVPVWGWDSREVHWIDKIMLKHLHQSSESAATVVVPTRASPW